MNRRDARRERNRADYERATQQAVAAHPSLVKSLSKMGIPLSDMGKYAGNTLQEHLEDQMKRAVRQYTKATKDRQDFADTNPYVPLHEDGDYRKLHDRVTTSRGIIRGLAIAILAQENSYSLGDMDAVKAIEKEFLK